MSTFYKAMTILFSILCVVAGFKGEALQSAVYLIAATNYTILFKLGV